MLRVEDWAEIRRLRFAEKVPIKQIARQLGISKNTVKAKLAADAPPRYERVAAAMLAQPPLAPATGWRIFGRLPRVLDWRFHRRMNAITLQQLKHEDPLEDLQVPPSVRTHRSLIS